MATSSLLNGPAVNWNNHQPVAIPQAFNPKQYNTVPTLTSALNKALQSGQINQSQKDSMFAQQFKTIQAPMNGPKPTLLGSLAHAAPQAPKTLFNVVKSVAQFAPQQIASVAHSDLPTHSSVPAELLQGIQKMPVNQRVQALTPANKLILQNAKFNTNDLSDQNINNFIKQDTIKAQQAASVTPKGTLATAILGKGPIQNIPARVQGSEQTLGTGVHIPLTNTTVHATGTLGKVLANVGVGSTVAGAIAPVEGAVGAGEKVSGKVAVATGKDEATNALINSQKAAQATKAATLADRLGAPAVEEANTTRIPVTEAKPPTQIPVTGKSTQVAGKVATASDSKYIAASNKLSDQYEKDLAKVNTVSHPVTQQVLQRQLDTKYNGLQQKLDDTYGKTSVSFKGKPTTLAEAKTTAQTALPKSALDSQTPVEPFNSTRIPVTDSELKPITNTATTPKEPKTAPKQATAKIADLTSYEGAPDKAKVAAYKADIEAGKPIQPILVSKDSLGNLGVEDGKHRLEAAKQAGLTEVPIKDVTPKTSGSALSAESRAVQKGLVDDLGDKATYKPESYKTEANNAVQLTHDNPQKAMDIALGNKPGNNAIHEVAVRRAVENKALQEGDVGTLTRLASSSQHTATSEAAQRLGAEGFSADRNSPVQAIKEISQSRTAALGKNADKVLDSTAKDIKTAAAPAMKVSRQDWHSFITDLQCK